ncbi:MAG: flagellar protein FlgN [Desulfovibrionales bacterium]|nr:flagellar protein FlgN [Desulfovibrionales bacterium]
MYTETRQNLHRQEKALEVLQGLLTEEFAELRERKPESITALEFSIHELMRQIANERSDLKESLGGKRLKEVLPLLTEEQQETLNALLVRIDSLEKRCSRQAAMNAELALALHDQSQALLSHIQTQIQPRKNVTYGKTGAYTQSRPEAVLLHGRL